MLYADDIRAWLDTLPADAYVAIDGIHLVVWTSEHNQWSLDRGNPSLEVGLYPIGMA